MSSNNTPVIDEIPVTFDTDKFLDTMEKLKNMLSFMNPRIVKIAMDETNLWTTYEGVVDNNKVTVELNIDASNKFIEIVVRYNDEYDYLYYFENEKIKLKDIIESLEKLKNRVYEKTIVYQKRKAFVDCMREVTKSISLYGDYVSIHVDVIVKDEVIERIKLCRKILTQ